MTPTAHVFVQKTTQNILSSNMSTLSRRVVADTDFVPTAIKETSKHPEIKQAVSVTQKKSEST